MAVKTIKTGIIGTGAAAAAHADILREMPGCTIATVLSRKRSRALEFIERHGLESALACDTLEDFLGCRGLQAVSICTPHPNHPAEAIACAEAGKHLIIEKPVAMNRRDLASVAAAVRKAGVRTSVCFELHWIGLFRNIQAILKKKMIGNVYYGEASYFHGIGPHVGQYGWNIRKETGGSALLTAGCHALDALVHFMGSRVVEVAAMSNTSAKNPWGYEYDPNSVLILRFENGSLGKVATSIECRQPYMLPVLLMGDRGSIHNDRLASLDFPAQDGWATIPAHGPESGLAKDHPYRGQFEEFFAALRKGRDPRNNLDSAAHVHEVMFAAEKAARTGRTVRVPSTPGIPEHRNEIPPG